MASSSSGRLRCLVAAAGVVTAIALALGVIVLTIGASSRDAWWLGTGQAFAADARSPGQDPCDLVVGPARAYCERDTSTTPPARHLDVAGAVGRLVPAAAGLTALMVWRRRNAGAGRRRR